MKQIATISAALALILAGSVASAHAPIVSGATADQRGESWTISVTIDHTETGTGWDHYADGWEVLAPDGTSLGVRVLVHPHVNEQPFTRSLGSVNIPAGATHVFIRARDNTEGWASDQFRLDLSN